MRLVRPLHRRPRASAFFAAKIVAHAELIAVPNHWCARQGEHQTVRQSESAGVATKHGSQPSSDPTIVKLHVFIRPKGFEYGLPLFLLQASEVKLVVISQKESPLCRRRPRFGRLQGFN